MVVPDGVGWRVFTILLVEEIPGPNHWFNGPWLKLLFELKQSGVDLEGMLGWAILIAHSVGMAGGCIWTFLSEVELRERVERELRDHSRDVPALVQPVVESSVAGLVGILGSFCPTWQEWNDYHWVKSLFELQERGVKVEDFQAWGRFVACRMRPVEVENLSNDNEPAETIFKEVDGPECHKTVVPIVPIESRKGKEKLSEEAGPSSMAIG